MQYFDIYKSYLQNPEITKQYFTALLFNLCGYRGSKIAVEPFSISDDFQIQNAPTDRYIYFVGPSGSSSLKSEDAAGGLGSVHSNAKTDFYIGDFSYTLEVVENVVSPYSVEFNIATMNGVGTRHMKLAKHNSAAGGAIPIDGFSTSNNPKQVQNVIMNALRIALVDTAPADHTVNIDFMFSGLKLSVR